MALGTVRLSPAGTPLLTDGGMWARMTVLGVTRIGFGDPPGRNSGPNAIKETIGDFIRNAAMRFGVGTYLWSKSEAAAAKKIAEEDHDVEPPQQRAQQQPPPQQQPPSVDWQQSLIDAQATRIGWPHCGRGWARWSPPTALHGRCRRGNPRMHTYRGDGNQCLS